MIHFNKYDFLNETLSNDKINNKTNIKSSSDAEYHLEYLQWCTRAHRFRCRDEIICVRIAIKNTYLTVITKRRLTCAVPQLNRFVLVTIIIVPYCLVQWLTRSFDHRHLEERRFFMREILYYRYHFGFSLEILRVLQIFTIY